MKYKEEKESVQEEYGNTERAFTHFDAQGNAVMVDVSGKDITLREATAEGVIRMSQQCFELVRSGGMKKGDVLGVARIAGIMGAKRTAELIPLCHILGALHSPVQRENRCRDGGADRRERCTAHNLRHVQSGRPQHGNGTGPPCQKIGRKIRTFRKSAACDKIYINRTAIGHNVQNSEMTAREFSGRQESAALPIPASAALSVCFSWRECRPEFHRPAEV